MSSSFTDLRRSRGLSQTLAAAYLGVSVATIRRMDQGHRKVKSEEWARVAALPEAAAPRGGPVRELPQVRGVIPGSLMREALSVMRMPQRECALHLGTTQSSIARYVNERLRISRRITWALFGLLYHSEAAGAEEVIAEILTALGPLPRPRGGQHDA